MIVANQADGGGIANLAHNLYARASLADTETLASKNLPIALRMEFGKALGELEFTTIDGQGPIGALLPLDSILREAIGVNAQEIAYTRLLEAEIASHAVEAHHMDDILLHWAKNPLKHVIEVNANVGGDTAALMDIALPGSVIPFAAGGNIGQIYVIDFVRRALVHLLLKRDNGLVQAELEDIISLVTGLFLYLLESVNIVGVQNHRLLADDVTT